MISKEKVLEFQKFKKSMNPGHGKLTFLKKSQGKLKLNNYISDVIPLNAGSNMSGLCDLHNVFFFLFFFFGSTGWRLVLHINYYLFVSEILFLSGKIIFSIGACLKWTAEKVAVVFILIQQVKEEEDLHEQDMEKLRTAYQQMLAQVWKRQCN